MIETDANGLRTFSWVAEYNGVFRDCGDPVRRGLTGTVVAGGADEPIRLRAGDNRELSVVWPAGFSASREPLSLRNDQGQVVATDGDVVDFPDVDPASAIGTKQDPYIASGRVFGGCYAYEPGG